MRAILFVKGNGLVRISYIGYVTQYQTITLAELNTFDETDKKWLEQIATLI